MTNIYKNAITKEEIECLDVAETIELASKVFDFPIRSLIDTFDLVDRIQLETPNSAWHIETSKKDEDVVYWVDFWMDDDEGRVWGYSYESKSMTEAILKCALKFKYGIED